MSRSDHYVTVAVDGSLEAQAAARFAVQEATIRTADLRVAHAYQLPEGPRALAPDVFRWVAEESERTVDATVAALHVPATMRVETVLQQASPLDLLTRLETSSDLIVFGHPAPADSPRPPIGGLLHQLLAHATCAVAVVPRTWYPPRDRRLPVLVAIDGKSASANALRWAFEEAVGRGTELRVVHVLRPGTSAEELQRRRLDVGEVLASWRADYPDVVMWADMIRGEPTLALIEWSRFAAVLVVGHPHTLGIAPWSRSVARTLSASSACPLVVVPAALRSSDDQHEPQRPAVSSSPGPG